MSLTTADLRTTTGAIRGLRQAVTAAGPEAETFLQGQLSQDIAAMSPRESRWSLLLHPQGKVAAWLRVTRLADDRFVLDVDAGFADQVIARLERFKLRTKCELAVSDHDSLTIIGPDALDTPVVGGELELHDLMAGIPVVVVFGANPSADVPELAVATYDALRIEDGRPAMGRELDDNTIPAAAGIVTQSVSFTKGCYTGQELVARVDSRGNNVPRRLVGLRFGADRGGADAVRVVPAVGSAITLDGAEAGVVTTVAMSTQLGEVVALSYASRAVEIGATVEVAGEAAVVHELPLVAG